MKTLVLLTIGVALAGQASAETSATSASHSSSVSTSAAAEWTGGPPPGFGPPPGWTPPPGFRPPWLSDWPTAATATKTVTAPASNSTALETSGGSTFATTIRTESSHALAEATAPSSNGTVSESSSPNSTGSAVGIGVGVGVGVAILLIAAAVFAFFFIKRRKARNNGTKHDEEPFSPGRNNSTYGGDTLTARGGYTSPQTSSPSEMATVANMTELNPNLATAAAKYELGADGKDRYEMDAEDKVKLGMGYYNPANRGPHHVELPGDTGWNPT